MAQTRRVTRILFPLAELVFLGGIRFPANYQDPGMVHYHPAVQLLPHAGPHPACSSWREGGQTTCEAGADNSLAKDQMPLHGNAEQSLPHSLHSAQTPPLAQGGQQQLGTSEVLGLRLFHPFSGLCQRPKGPYSCRAGTEQGMDPPPTPLPTSFPAWSILTWHILPPLSPSTAPAPSSPTLESPGTPVKAAQQLMGKGIWEVFPMALSSLGLYFTSGWDLSPAQAQAP